MCSVHGRVGDTRPPAYAYIHTCDALTCTFVYIQNQEIIIYKYIYPYQYIPTFLRVPMCTHVDTCASKYLCVCDYTHTHMRARASAVPPRTTPAHVEDRPSASAAGRTVGRTRCAHTYSILITDAVFHAPMFALNADAHLNACAPKPQAVDADGQGLARFRVSGSRPSPQHEPATACAHRRSIPIAHWCTHT